MMRRNEDALMVSNVYRFGFVITAFGFVITAFSVIPSNDRSLVLCGSATSPRVAYSHTTVTCHSQMSIASFTSLLLLISFCLAVVVVNVSAADWAVVVSGSNAYNNYRHQADACHAYQLLHEQGNIPSSRIITFLYDDVPHVKWNPWKEKMFNQPSVNSSTGGGEQSSPPDVYKNMQKDYTGSMVRPDVFLQVLQGNVNVSANITKVLNTTAQDRIFVYWAGHGVHGMVFMPYGGILYASDFVNTLISMHSNSRYSQIVLYIEACNSGSMFADLLPNNISAYAVTAADPFESSFGTYCPPEDIVDGKEMNTCLGDEFSINWMNDTSVAFATESNVTLQEQYELVKEQTKSDSHVMQYGDLEFIDEMIQEFMGDPGAKMMKGRRRKNHHYRPASSFTFSPPPPASSSSTIPAPSIPRHLAYYRWLRAEAGSIAQHQALNELQSIDASQAKADRTFRRLAEMLAVELDLKSADQLYLPPRTPIVATPCIRSSMGMMQSTESSKGGACIYDEYSMSYHAIIVNACQMYEEEEIREGSAGLQRIQDIIQQVCDQ